MTSERGDNPQEFIDESLDGVILAPESHRVVKEDEKIRVLEISIPPGEKEPFHTHPRSSIMIIDQSATIRYWTDSSSFKEIPRKDASPKNPHIELMDPEI